MKKIIELFNYFPRTLGIITAFIIMFIVACNFEKAELPLVKPNTITTSTVMKVDDFTIRYFMDSTTHKCFAERGLSTTYSFTCVPCDSAVLKKIKEQSTIE